MGKSSSKKRRQQAKRRMELDKLRGVALLDASTPPKSQPSFSSHSLAIGQSSSPARSTGKIPISSTSQSPTTIRSRKRVDFVLPRALGKSDTYVFAKQGRGMLNEELQTIREEDEGDENQANSSNGRNKATRPQNESIEEILYPDRKRRRGDATNGNKTPDKSNIKVSPRRDKDTSTDDQVSVQKNENKKVKKIVDAEMSRKAEVEAKALKLKDIPKTKHIKSTIDEPREVPNVSRNFAFINHTMNGGRLSGLSVEDAVRDKVGLRPRANSTDGELNLPQRGLCDERLVLEAHQWNLVQNRIHHSKKPKGFVNLGNTCFLNATLQCLAYLPPFCQSLVALSEAKGSLKNGLKQSLSQGQRITATLCSLFQNIHGLNAKSTFSGSIAPNGIVKALPTIGTCGSRNGHKFRQGRQEDAHEFLVHLLDAMNDGELRSAGINQHASGWRDRLPVPRLDETTFVHRIFGGYLRSQVRCIFCDYRSNTYDPFLDLSLEVSKKSSSSFTAAFSEFCRKETLDAENKWKCSGCKKHVCATKQLTVFRPPLSLCIQLKRFAYDGGIGAHGLFPYGGGGGGGGWKHGNHWNRGGSKITKPIEFPVAMDLPLSDGRKCPYVLTGIVIHVGGSASSGHYTAYVKKPGMNGNSQWFLCDDSYVEPVSEGTVLRQKDAYVLFYCRKEVKLEFPSPPPRGSMSAEEAKELGRVRARARADSFASEDGNSSNTPLPRKRVHGINPEDRQKPQVTVDKGNHKTSSRVSALQNGPAKRTKADIHPLASPSIPSQKDGNNSSTDSSSSSSDSDSASAQVIKKKSREASLSTIDITRYAGKPGLSSLSQESNNCRISTTRLPRPDEVKATERTTVNVLPLDSKIMPKKGSMKASSESRQVGEPSSESDSSRDDTSESASDSGSEPSKAASEQKPTTGSRDGLSGNSEQNTGGERLLQQGNQSRKEKKESQSELSSSDSSASVDDVDSDGACMGTPEPAVSPPTNHLTSTARNLETAFARRDSVDPAVKEPLQKEPTRTRVVLERGDSRGKVEVMLGPRRRKRPWQAKVAHGGGKGFELLGNVGVSQWGEDDGGGRAGNGSLAESSQDRAAVVKQMEKQERKRKRQRHLDRWDALLDQGKRKKVKKKDEESSSQGGKNNPKKNVFQKIQSGLQSMNRGKAKGFFRRNQKGSRSSF